MPLHSKIFALAPAGFYQIFEFMGKITKLPEWVANRIAAGEVVENPGSVVKELVENSVDAGAAYIEIILAGGGKDLIQVIDDGEGMSPEDALMALQRHATSKISDVDDLNRITTLGFRGEALPSIASVSVMELVTRRAEDEMGFRILVDNGEIVEQGEVGARKGTTVTVRELFARVPARRRFLKSDRAELNRCVIWITRLALANPEISFRAEHNEREIIYAPAVGSFLERIEQLFGAEIAQNLLPIQYQTGDYTIYGFVGNRTLHRAKGTEQYFFLNRRAIKSSLLSGAVKRAYSGLIPPGRHPVVFVFIEADPALVDVNVHPAKIEVRFRREEAVFHAVYRAIADAVGSVPSPAAMPKNVAKFVPPVDALAQTLNFPEVPRRAPGRKIPPQDPVAKEVESVAERIISQKFAPSREVQEQPKFFQIFNTYIITATDSEVLIMDQHAAHERILYEKVLDALASEEYSGQRLLFPVEVSVPPHWVSSLADFLDRFAAAGFEIEIVGQNRIKLISVPPFVRNVDYARLITDILRDLAEGEETPEITKNFAASVACHSAIKAGQPLSQDEMESLFDALFACDDPLHCPHGRPTVIKFSIAQIERMFGRT